MKGTIKKNEDVERLFAKGRRSSSSCMTILVLASQRGLAGRCAFIAGKKLGAAPLRSRCKRVLRETARSLGAPWVDVDVVFLARRKVAYENHQEVKRQMSDLLLKLGVTNEDT